MVALDAHQQDTYRRGIARANGDRAKAIRVVLCFFTESKGRQLRNDGGAFHPDPKKRVPGWADNWPAARCQPIYDVLRTSLAYPDHGTGSNGGSTGAAQGLSDDYLTARFGRPTSYGWGTIEQQLNPSTGVEFIADAFLSKLRVSTQPVYSYTNDAGKPAQIRTADPAIADVMRVQQMKPSEAESDNYGADELAASVAIYEQLAGTVVAPTTPGGTWLSGLIEWRAMADDVAVYWVTYNNAIWRANMLAGTYQVMRSMDKLGAAQRALDRAGIPHKSWEGQPSNMEEFGVEILDPGELADRLVGKIHDDVVAILRAPEFSQVTSGVNGVDYPTKQMVAWADLHASNTEAAARFLVEQAGGVAVESPDHPASFSYRKA